MFKAKTIIQEIKQLCPDIFRVCEETFIKSKKDLDFHFAKEMMDVIDVAIPGINGKKKPKKSSSRIKKAV